MVTCPLLDKLVLNIVYFAVHILSQIVVGHVYACLVMYIRITL